MIRIAWDQGFGKIYRKKVRNDALLKQRFWKAMELFSRNPFHPRLRTHKLSGKNVVCLLNFNPQPVTFLLPLFQHSNI
jgi:mRNA-degrading endonuclease YafQ of YafQ-DinJ toxin-antitoxin module